MSTCSRQACSQKTRLNRGRSSLLLQGSRKQGSGGRLVASSRDRDRDRTVVGGRWEVCRRRGPAGWMDTGRDIQCVVRGNNNIKDNNGSGPVLLTDVVLPLLASRSLASTLVWTSPACQSSRCPSPSGIVVADRQLNEGHVTKRGRSPPAMTMMSKQCLGKGPTNNLSACQISPQSETHRGLPLLPIPGPVLLWYCVSTV